MIINKFDVKKALLNHLVANSQGFDVMPEGSGETNSVDEGYLEESVLWGPNNINLNGRDNLEGIYQINVNTLIIRGDFFNLEQCDKIAESFGKGREANIQHDGQVVEIQNIDISTMSKNEHDTHLTHYISVNFRAV